jgi:hypothetical protein
MAIKEKWMPSPNYSSSRGPYNVLAFHTTEGAMTIESLGNWFAQSSAGCSSHHGADNSSAGLLGAYVYENHKAWTQGNANNYCLSIELCAYASWSRSTWMGKNVLLSNAADWLRYMVDKYKIPWTVLSNSQAQSGTVKGICQHVNFGSMGSGHHDCGSGFPLDEVIKRAKSGSGGSTPTPSGEDVSASSVMYDGQLHMACVWSDGRVNYAGPDGKWYAVDPKAANKAKSGAHITVNANSGLLVITYTNTDGQVCTWQKNVTDGKDKWGWYGRGGNARLARAARPGGSAGRISRS